MMKDKARMLIENWAKEKLAVCDTGHDWWHIVRVRNSARQLHEMEGGDWEVIELAVLLHDVADAKFFNELEALMLIEQELGELGFGQEVIDHVLLIIKNLSYSKQWSNESFDSLEFRIVQDADRLDAIGAIGIARTFNYGGSKGRDLYNPNQAPRTYEDAQEYHDSESPTINHFYEKLLLLKDQMKTKTGQRMAEDRHCFMEAFLKQFYKEWGE